MTMTISELILTSLVIISFILNIFYYMRYRKEHFQKVFIDSLTTIYNRKFLEEIHTMYNDLDKRFDIVFGDIDHFKKVNDTYGHDVGDEVLQITGKKLRKNFKDTDYIVRYGGEEFIIFISKDKNTKNNNNSKKLYNRIEKIRKLFEEQTLNINNQNIQYTMSFGIVPDSKNITSLDTQIKLADELLYKSKNTGRNKISMFNQKENNNDNNK